MINVVRPINIGNQGKNEEVQFWAEYKFGRNKEIVRFLILYGFMRDKKCRTSDTIYYKL
jgi:hypothetical protein